MIEMVANILSWVLIATGSFFVVVGAIGLLRMPDLYTRLHAVSVIDTVGAAALFGGMMIQAGFTLISVKLLILMALFFFTTPVATHAVAQAARLNGIEPELGKDASETQEGQGWKRS